MVPGHRTIYRDDSLTAQRLPFIEEMKGVHENGGFPLVQDPVKEKKTLMIGMFVLRPSREAWDAPIGKGDSSSIYEVNDWVYHVKNLYDGGAVTANGNVMDVYRLTMQYALCDAVIMGSGSVLNDALPRPDGSGGYLWQPYFSAGWPHAKKHYPHMLSWFQKERALLQKRGYASQRKYPAQIIISRSGKRTSPDLLESRLFHDHHPEGEPLETYIVTSEAGARAIRARGAEYGLADRMDRMLIVLSPPHAPEEIQLERLPSLLYSQYGMVMANHDGGGIVLEAFCQAGIVPQFNFTFARGPSLYQALSQNTFVDPLSKQEALGDFDQRICRFFKSSPQGRMPRNYKIVEMITDEKEEAVVAVLDTRTITQF